MSDSEDSFESADEGANEEQSKNNSDISKRKKTEKLEVKEDLTQAAEKSSDNEKQTEVISKFTLHITVVFLFSH